MHKNSNRTNRTLYKIRQQFDKSDFSRDEEESSNSVTDKWSDNGPDEELNLPAVLHNSKKFSIEDF